MQRVISVGVVACLVVLGLFAVRSVSATGDGDRRASCEGLPDERALRAWLREAPGVGGSAGGLFEGRRMWGAVVNRDGEICAYATSTSDRTQVWPGSQAIAKSKAYTANAFSLDALALSSARLYTFTQPGHSLWSLGQSNLFDTAGLLPPGGPRTDVGDILGGLIFFGGGVPLDNQDGKIVGGLGVSGDTSCADHEIAKRVRSLAELNPPEGLWSTTSRTRSRTVPPSSRTRSASTRTATARSSETSRRLPDTEPGRAPRPDRIARGPACGTL